MSAKWTFWAWEVDIKTAPKKLALLQLANNADDDGKSWYAIAKMAKACGVAERTFQRQIQSLENDNLLKVDRRSNRSSVYHLQDSELITLIDTGDTLTGGGDTLTGQGDSVTPLGVTESRTILTIYPTNDPDNKDICRFSEFWDMYDKKTGLDKCKQKFKKLSDKEQIDVLHELPAYIQSTPDKQYRKNPLKWLNGKHWNDEITTPVNQSPESMNTDTDWAKGILS